MGRAGFKVSRICLGTMTFGAGADEATSFSIMDRFAELGGTFLDTANVYNEGLSEEIVGKWIKEHGVRDQTVLATKVYGMTGPGPNESGLSRLHIQQAVEASLRRLQTDVIDLYQIHRWDFDTSPEETLEALNDLVRQGKVRYIGCSNLKAWHLSTFLRLADEAHWARFVSIQPLYSALNRARRRRYALQPACRGRPDRQVQTGATPSRGHTPQRFRSLSPTLSHRDDL
jgi:aryl-alcohol dehydrogenase-like predicted oxidoreductase